MKFHVEHKENAIVFPLEITTRMSYAINESVSYANPQRINCYESTPILRYTFPLRFEVLNGGDYTARGKPRSFMIE